MNYTIESLRLDTEPSDSELLTIFHILVRCTKDESGCTPAWAAQEINKDSRDGPVETLQGYCWGFWSLLIDFVQETDADHPAMDRLAEVVAELKKLPDAIKIKVDGCSGERLLWTDLPVLEMDLLERFSAHEYGQPSLIKEDQDVSLRLNSFTARLLNINAIGTTRPSEFLQYTLEEEQPCMEWDLEAASEYILRAGNTIFEHLDDPKWTESAFKGGALYTGTRGINKERWDFWKKRFRECGEAVSPGRAQQKALEAAQKMDAIEAQAAEQ